MYPSNCPTWPTPEGWNKLPQVNLFPVGNINDEIVEHNFLEHKQMHDTVGFVEEALTCSRGSQMPQGLRPQTVKRIQREGKAG